MRTELPIERHERELLLRGSRWEQGIWLETFKRPVPGLSDLTDYSGWSIFTFYNQSDSFNWP